MTPAVDPELLVAVGHASHGVALERTLTARGDWRSLRAACEAALAGWEAAAAQRREITRCDFGAVSRDGALIRLRWYTPPGYDASAAGPAALYLHGGGMILGSVDLYDRWVAVYVADSGVPLLAVDYRRAPQTGGGLAAAVALLARGRGPALARQLLIYPMLDDRTTVPDPSLLPFAAWSYDDNYTGWWALLGDAVGGSDVPAAAAPARAEDVSGLPPTFVEVGELDIFRDESIQYARRIAAAGTSVELHVHPGCPDGFERVGSQAEVVRRSRADRIRVLRSF